MLFMGVNLWAVLGAALATMAIGFLWYSPALFGKPWMLAMGYDAEDKAKIAEMQKTAGPKYGIAFLASPERIYAGQDHVPPCRHYLLLWNQAWFWGLARVRDDRAAHGQALQQSPAQAVPDQYRVSVCVLSGHGSHCRQVGGVLMLRHLSSP